MHTSNKLLIGSRFHSHLMPTGGQEEEFGRGRAEAHSSEPSAAALGSGFTSKHSRSTSSAISAWTASAIAHSTAFRRRLGRRDCEWLIKAVMVYLTMASTWIPVVTRGSSSGGLVWLGGGRPAPRCLGRVTGALRPPGAHMEPQLAPTEVFVWAGWARSSPAAASCASAVTWSGDERRPMDVAYRISPLVLSGGIAS